MTTYKREHLRRLERLLKDGSGTEYYWYEAEHHGEPEVQANIDEIRDAMRDAANLIWDLIKQPCGHSACAQHYIDTGERRCLRESAPSAEGPANSVT